MEQTNAHVSLVTLLNSDYTTFHHREVILPTISKFWKHSQEKIVVELVFRIVIGEWIEQLERLECRSVTLGKKGQFCKDFFEIFEILKHPFLLEDFKKIICSGAFGPVAVQFV